MIGLVLRMVTAPSASIVSSIVAPLVLALTLCGCYKVATCRARDCWCLKSWLRYSGTDEFDDFELVVLVHDVSVTSSSRLNYAVRLTAGAHKVTTDSSQRGIFQQPMSIWVEQGMA